MGADQSSMPTTTLKSQRDEDIPYTSCTISKPIGADAPRSSPRLLSKSKSASRDSRESSAVHKIIVVTEGTSAEPQVDTEMQRLESIPIFFPLLKTSVNIPGQLENDSTPGQLDMRHVLGLCVRYQEHLKQCAEAVAFDQNALCVRIKEVDLAIQTMYNNLTERRNRFAKYTEQIQKVNEITTTLTRIQTSLEQTIPIMDRLNSVLPLEEQLEPFTFKQPGHR